MSRSGSLHRNPLDELNNDPVRVLELKVALPSRLGFNRHDDPDALTAQPPVLGVNPLDDENCQQPLFRAARKMFRLEGLQTRFEKNQVEPRVVASRVSETILSSKAVASLKPKCILTNAAEAGTSGTLSERADAVIS